MPALFNAKYWNDEVFQGYLNMLPHERLNMMLKSGAIVQNPNLKTVLNDNTGGNYIQQAMTGRIGGTPVNYDGQTNITTSGLDTYMQGKVVVGRAKGWTEKDFTYDITGGHDFMRDIASQVHDYWEDIDQDTLSIILSAIFQMTGTGNTTFVNNHTYDATGITNAYSQAGILDGTTINTAMQKACGDRKSQFSMAIMHSVVATNLENLKILRYATYTDKDGIERPTDLAYINGRAVLVDDTGTVDTSGSNPVYKTFVLGRGAIEYCDCGAKVPSEVDRDPATNGGQDMLYTRQRKLWAPHGISYLKTSQATESPTDAELGRADNWGVVKNGAGTVWYPHKFIPIAMVKSLG